MKETLGSGGELSASPAGWVTDKSGSKQDGGHRERGKKQTWRRVWEALWLRHLSGSVGWRVRIDMDTRDPEEKAGTSWHIVGDQGRV